MIVEAPTKYYDVKNAPLSWDGGEQLMIIIFRICFRFTFPYGVRYLTTSQKLDALRDMYLIDSDKVTSYQLGQNGAEEEEKEDAEVRHHHANTACFQSL